MSDVEWEITEAVASIWEVVEATTTIQWTVMSTLTPPSGAFDGEHNDLDGRSTADAHPISAITGLTAALVGLQTVGWDFLYDGVNFDLSTDEIDGVPRTVVLAAGARVGTHELPLRAATESDAGQHWSIEYFCGGDGFTVLRVPDPLGHSPQYVDLAGLKVDGVAYTKRDAQREGIAVTW